MINIQDLINKKTQVTEGELTALAYQISKERNLKLAMLEFGDWYPMTRSDHRAMFLNNDIEADWVQSEINSFKNSKELNYINNPKMTINLLNTEIPMSFYNSFFIFVLIHELRHIEQEFMISEERGELGKYLNTSKRDENRSELEFKYHDKLFFEFDANLHAMKELSKCKLDPLFESYIAYKFLIAYTDKFGQEFKSPFENNLELCEDIFKNIEKPVDENVSLGASYSKVKKIDTYYQMNY